MHAQAAAKSLTKSGGFQPKMNQIYTFFVGPVRYSLFVHTVISTLVALSLSVLSLVIAKFLFNKLEINFKTEGAISSDFNYLTILVVGVVLTPILETMLVVLSARSMLERGVGSIQVLLIVAFCAGIIHALLDPIWFFGVFWSFFVFTSCYIVWRRVSESIGFIAALVPHSTINLISYLGKWLT